MGNWTHHLDEVFKKNLEDDPLLKWQYFCSSTGFFKFYPGSRVFLFQHSPLLYVGYNFYQFYCRCCVGGSARRLKTGLFRLSFHCLVRWTEVFLSTIAIVASSFNWRLFLPFKRYVGAASYPIEMIILADKSGSMKGRRNTICNATISELLNTLTDDDFFNVIYVSRWVNRLIEGDLLY